MRLSCDKKKIITEVNLPSSKSISNRVLILRHLLFPEMSIQNLSEANDTQLLKKALQKIKAGENHIDIEDAGTDFRFLTALLSITPGNWVLTGSARLKERPISSLVDAMRKSGADITYKENEGFAPLMITGQKLKGGKIAVDARASSQFVSALLLIAPSLENGLEIDLPENPASYSYIKMTMGLLRDFGITLVENAGKIRVMPVNSGSDPSSYKVEADWSSASYWYSICALCEGSQIKLKGLNQISLQGDSVLPQIYEKLGVKTEFSDACLVLKHTGGKVPYLENDFSDCPDIAQTVAVSCAALGIRCRLKGLSTLRYKETDRITALKNELLKLDCEVNASDSEMEIAGGPTLNPKHGIFNIQTYKDHRMAMSFAPLALLNELEMEDPDVVKKSYPGFWTDLKAAGFMVE